MLAQNAQDLTAEGNLRVDKNGAFLTEEQIRQIGIANTFTPYVTPVEQVERWIEFLKHCGGFEVC